MGRVIMVMMLAVILASGSVISGCSSDSAPPPVVQIGSPAPDFQLQRLDGQPVSLSSLQGRPVMLNFWATWCGPCQMEIPFLQEAFEDEEWTELGLVILAVNLGEAPATVKKFMEDNGLNFPVLLDTDTSVAGIYNVSGIPTTFFIDRNGIIKDKKMGPFPSKADLDWRLINSIVEYEPQGG